MTTSELRRVDRRGVTPQHLLYMAMKIMRFRIRDSLTVAFKHVGKNANITHQQIESEEYISNCIENNIAFLRAIPNSMWYWSERKRDLFSMIRQLGKPTVFLTMSANEIGWTGFLQLLYKFKDKGREISKDIQFVTEEYPCAAYVVEYVNKANRGISNLQRQIIKIMDEHSDFDIVEITRNMSIDKLIAVEMASQEAAWYLLRQPMSKSSVQIVYISTVLQHVLIELIWIFSDSPEFTSNNSLMALPCWHSTLCGRLPRYQPLPLFS
ncbi:helitron_like_N domain-containing protein [Trichonephila clavata]|uniref:Helitron_like_N domain-containing protein n=1 Tax=Trichonephila clavata TaxID=2740835 RepID=A0A8X6K706_TRICU|nr:helitron_like_N domain-containing protein [Trichonephila clavata]